MPLSAAPVKLRGLRLREPVLGYTRPQAIFHDVFTSRFSAEHGRPSIFFGRSGVPYFLPPPPNSRLLGLTARARDVFLMLDRHAHEYFRAWEVGRDITEYSNFSSNSNMALARLCRGGPATRVRTEIKV